MSYPELLMYAKPISFLVVIVIICMGVSFIKFTSSYILIFLFLACDCVILLIFWLTAVLTQHLYQDMKKYVVIVLMNIHRGNPRDNLIPNSISILFWRNMFMVSIKEDIIPNLSFYSSGPFLVIWSVSGNMYFDDTREV